MADLDWTGAGPRSRRFDDVYYSAESGLEEARTVFLQGAGLPERWNGRRRFVVGELGFGTGLNILALLQLWARRRPAGGRLHVFSVEAYPLTREEAERAAALWPEFAPFSDRLIDRWPSGAGLHRIDWPELGATLDVAHAEALPAVQGWPGAADAWFLDGFAPAKNPHMWSEGLLSAVAARSAPGARIATFTVAGAVRRGLQHAGFSVEKRPGFGRKRERLEAIKPGEVMEASPTRVGVVGAGVAGAAVCRALIAAGAEPVLVAPETAEASGNPAALVSPRFDAGDGPTARLMRQAFERAVDLYTDAPDAVIARGLLQFAARPRARSRLDAAAGRPGPRAPFARLSNAQASAQAGEPVDDALFAPDGLCVEPRRILETWTAGATRLTAKVSLVERSGAGRVLRDDAGRMLFEGDAVVLAGGWSGRTLCPELPLGAVRGQASWATVAAPEVSLAWGGYAAPMHGGLLFGATHDRGDDGSDVRQEDHARNLSVLASRLPQHAAAAQATGRIEGRAAVRAATPDRLPLAGRLDDGLFVLTGLGGRGFMTAPLLAEHVAALAADAPSPLPLELSDLVRPDRFAG